MKLTRQLSILYALSRGEPVTAPALAQRLEVSTRTIRRDIDDLCAAGYPIVTRQGAGGGISLMEGFALDQTLLTREELSDLLAGLRGLGSVGSGMALLNRLLQGQEQAQQSLLIDLATHYKSSLTGKITLLRSAIAAGRVVSFDYYSEKGRQRREAEPVFVLYRWADWYLYAHCRLRSDYRLFKLGRLWELQPEEATFAPHHLRPEQIDFDASFPDETEAVVLFEADVEHLVIETYGPHSYAKQADGRLLFRRGYTNLDFMAKWLLTFGGGAQVLSPPSLVEEVGKLAADVLSRYNMETSEQDK